MSRRLRAFGLCAAFLSTGCLSNKSADVRKDATVDSAVSKTAYDVADDAKPSRDDLLVGRTGRLIEPKRCGLSLATLTRPTDDPALNGVLWRAADEQVVSADVLRKLEANGLRVGLIAGSLPPEIDAVLNPPPPGKKVDIVSIDLPDGEQTDVELSKAVEPLTLLLNRDGRTFGKDYQDAKGFLRVTASHNGLGGVRLNVVPEIHHGPNRQGYAAAPSASPFQPQEFMVTNGQAAESFRDLAATVDLKPGQILAIGSRTDMTRGLGGFLFTRAEGDRVQQHVVLIWAQPTASITAASNPVRENALMRLNEAIKANKGKGKNPFRKDKDVATGASGFPRP